MKILGIETSCDETALCIIDAKSDAITILGNQLYSQVALHAQYGGVFPNLAKREHAKNLVPLFAQCLKDAGLYAEEKNTLDLSDIETILAREEDMFAAFSELAHSIKKPDIDAIAVTYGPGLEPALWVGISFAQALATLWDIPIMPINHMEGHIVVAPLEKRSETEYGIIKPRFPAIAYLASGGHTQIVHMSAPLQYNIIGNTLDDAIGEAFDKVARILELPYPGGPEISKLAEKEREQNLDKKPPYPLPRPMIHSKDLNFSFSGIKTAVLYTVKKIPKLTDAMRAQIAHEFEDAVIEVSVKKVSSAIDEYGVQTLIIGGGVSANTYMRTKFARLAKERSIDFLLPEVNASTDNAFMIAVAGYLRIQNGTPYATEIKANGNLSLS